MSRSTTAVRGPSEVQRYTKAADQARLARAAVVADAVLVEPVSNENSLLTGKLTGNFVKFLRAARF